MKYLALAALLFLAGYVGWHHLEHKPISLTNKPAIVKITKSAYIEPPQDTRSQAQWEADCRPVEAYNKNGIYSYWCTRVVNDFDKDQLLPADWTRVR